ncbi:hypothetical protein [Paenibacillus pini]|uniref:Uncharacterized protein n=2 Tax=Paenibacillus TaxID=44249 RepID=W7YXT6_9BACL|nr:hypothetical protein JCM16418_1228 [Paenibacillus pini JCM 16418]
MVRKMVLSQQISYGKEEFLELESASVKVKQIYDKAFKMLHRYLPESVWKFWIGVPPSQIKKNSEDGDIQEGTIFQKWIQGPSGWKCIGCEMHHVENIIPETDETPYKHEYIFHNGRLQSMLLQVIIWSQFEEITMFRPFLGDVPFYTDEEMKIISSYFVPTYVSETPLKQLGKPYKKHAMKFPVYQEFISAPPLVMHSDGEVQEGTWMTGVYVDQTNFLRLGPYLKNIDGRRTFMEAFID